VGVGDLWYFPGGIPHSLQGLGPDGCEFLLVFDDGSFDEDDTFLITDLFKHIPADVSLDQWMALTPPQLLQAHFPLDQTVMDNLHKKKYPVVPA
jgi:hypothetical protein